MAYEEELAAATAAAREAGDIMQRYRDDGFSLARKEAYTDIVTEADEAVQETIVERLHEAFPEDAIRGEEDVAGVDGENGRAWVIDPIDGTKNFVHGFPAYCTSIALKEDGEAVVGVVYNPVRDELFTAVRGEGAELNGEPLSVSAVETLPDALVLSRLSERAEERREIETRFLRDLLAQPSSLRRLASAALNLCYVAAGRADAFALISIHEWDVAAGTVILEEAGGTVRTRDSVVDGAIEVVASNGHVQADLEEVFDRNVRG